MDARQREFERRGASGDAEAAARVLRGRVRDGTLSAERLRIAAHVGDEAARIALGPDAPALELDLLRWVAGLGDHEAAVRVVLALGWLLLPCWEQVFPASGGPRTALGAARDALSAQGPHRGAVDRRLMAVAVGATQAIAFVREVTHAFGGAADAGASPLDDPEGALAWVDQNSALGPVLEALGLSPVEVIDALRRECTGPQGEASIQGVIASAFQRPLSGALMAARTCEAAQAFLASSGLAQTPSRTASALHNAGECARRVGRQLGSQPARDAIRDAIVPWALGMQGTNQSRAEV